MSALMALLILVLAPTGSAMPDNGAGAPPSASPRPQSHRDTALGHRTGDGTRIAFVGGTAVITFRPSAGSTRAVLAVRCDRSPCRGFEQPELLVPINDAPPLRVRFRRSGADFISTKALSRLPDESILSFALAGRRHSLRVR